MDYVLECMHRTDHLWPSIILFLQWSLDDIKWTSTENTSVTVQGLEDDVHSLKLKHEYSADGRLETENVEYL